LTPQHTLHIGIDDTDSTKGGCTTYLTANLIEKLQPYNIKYLDYPLLIRLNPNIPWKTRGNAALCLRLHYDKTQEQKIKETTATLLEKHATTNEKNTNPGIVFYKNKTIPPQLTTFTKQTQTNIVTLKQATTLIKKTHAEAIGYNNCRGIIGALAAIGETLQNDYTYELIAYRTPQHIGTKRQIDPISILEMDKQTQPHTYNNIDTTKNKILITPHGPDPILFGIRGETPEILKKAYTIIKPQEPVERWVIFRSNQGTDAHLQPIKNTSQLQPYHSVTLKGTVSKEPRTVPLRHIIFTLADTYGEIDCAAYEPTGDLCKTARQLETGDLIEVSGAVHKATTKRPLTINLEKIHILQLAEKVQTENPLCPGCGKHLKSMGKKQGFRCERCGDRFTELKKTEFLRHRSLKGGLYVASTRSQRHLTKPLRRYGQEKKDASANHFVDQWHSP